MINDDNSKGHEEVVRLLSTFSMRKVPPFAKVVSVYIHRTFLLDVELVPST